MAELIWVYDLAGVQVAVFHQADTIQLEELLQQSETLSFNVRIDDPKIGYVVEDAMVRYRGRFYRMSKPERIRGESGPVVHVEAEPVWMELLERIKLGVFSLVGDTITEGLTAILADTDWTVGTVESNGGSFSIEESDKTVLVLVREWAALTEREIVWDTAAKTVDLVLAQGDAIGVGFRYGFNLRTVRRQATPPVCTRLYAYGATNVSIATVNPTGKPYVEDFSWYTDQGIPLATAQALYLKEQIWVDERYLNALHLYDAAIERLAELAQPQVSYEATVADLSAVTGWPEDAWAIGDIIRVRDDPLDVDVDARVVRLIRKPQSPAENEIELAFLQGFEDEITRERDGLLGGSQFALLVDENPADLTIGSSLLTLHQFALSFPSQGNVVVGFDIAAVASAATGTIKISFWWGTLQVGPLDLRIDFAASAKINVSVPVALVGLQGSDNLYVRAQIVTGSATLAVPAAQARVYLLVDGMLGGGVNTAPNIDINDAVATFLIDNEDTVIVSLLTPDDESPTEDVDTTPDTVTETVTVTLT